MVDDVSEEFLAYILAPEVPNSSVWRTTDKGFTEDVAGGEESVHPSSALGVGHDSFGVVDAITFGQAGCFLSLADVFTV